MTLDKMLKVILAVALAVAGFVVIKWLLTLAGIILPAVLITLIGVVIAILVIIYAMDVYRGKA